jgi:2-methylaconitate cis-trans-isomerase PrpF
MTDGIRCVILRGGTSKGIYLRAADLPTDAGEREATILRIFGSPDKRQIDGLGGADPLTSKVCVISPPDDHAKALGAHLTYTFGQVEIEEPVVDLRSLCGNLTSGVGAFAIWENMVVPQEPITTVRIYNTNLERMLVCEVPVRDGKPLEAGDYAIPGVPGYGARIQVDFADTAGSSTGALLPTGNPIDRLEVPGVGILDVSLVDIGNAHVFVRAADFGLDGTETAQAIDADEELLKTLERVRAYAGAAMGMVEDPERARALSPATPLIAMVAPANDYENALAGETVPAHAADFLSRLMFMQQMHKTYAGTSTVCTGIASRLEGTLVHSVSRPETRDAPVVRIGHPAGVIETESALELEGNGYRVTRATLGRTARRILEGRVFIAP